MCITTGFLFLVSIFGVIHARQSSSSDIIWFPIEEIKDGYASSLGEVYVTSQPNNWEFVNIDGLKRRRFRSVADESRLNGFNSEGTRNAEDEIVFPDDEGRLNLGNVEVCERSCPNTPEYNPICGSDLTNYRNMGALKCSQFCGKDVRFVHFGLCGRGFPIFKPSPKPPRKVRMADVNGINW